MLKKPRSRIAKMSVHETQLTENGYHSIAGVDEAGRGPLAGPVFAAACILPSGVIFRGLNDSKQLSPEKRESLFKKLMNTEGVFFGLGIATRNEIDAINIFHATMLAMQRAVLALSKVPDFLLIDGNKAPELEIPSKTLVDGDCLSISIAAASIIAKVLRDRHMCELDQKWPHYGFAKHKGYCTDQHLQAIEKWGPCPEHRMSFYPFSKSELCSQLA
ncbi:MAG TPA: ribonuclease HII [Chlamydiales bacterium]|nr:ribonuclease HII [Chlamydiales bacterium]